MSIKKNWLAVEAWIGDHAPKARAVLRPGASDADLEKLETTVGAPLPADLRELLQGHDGQKIPPFLSTVMGFMLMPCSDIATAWTEYGELLDAGDIDRPAKSKSGTVKPVWWSKKWIPFAEGAGGDLLCVDLDPAKKGTAGQVLRFWHDEDWRDQLAPSVDALLAAYLDGLAKGEFEVNELGGISLA